MEAGEEGKEGERGVEVEGVWGAVEAEAEDESSRARLGERNESMAASWAGERAG